MEGYGLYFFLLECIAGNIESHNLTFELEEDAELISAATGIHNELVAEMMVYMVNLGLFEESNGIITCIKMSCRTDEYTQKLLRNPKSVRTLSRQTPDKVPPIRTEQNRTEQNRKRFNPPSGQDVREYISNQGYTVSPDAFLSHYEAVGWKVGKNAMKDWKAAVRSWQSREPKASEQEMSYT